MSKIKFSNEKDTGSKLENNKSLLFWGCKKVTNNLNEENVIKNDDRNIETNINQPNI